MLDPQEHLHLAIKASEKGLHKEALEELHLCLEGDPENAIAIFLLAAEHAEIGMYDRAKEEMTRALELDPGIEMAYIQLGLIYGQEGDNDSAVKLWKELEQKTEDPSLASISKGLIKLTEGEQDEASAALRNGMELNKSNPSLNVMVENILNSLGLSSEGDQETETKKEEESGNGESVYLGAYQKGLIGEDQQ